MFFLVKHILKHTKKYTKNTAHNTTTSCIDLAADYVPSVAITLYILNFL